jgi:hypothetical protein
VEVLMSDFEPQAGEGVSGAEPVQRGEAAEPVAPAVAELDNLPELDLAEHPDVYERIHAELQGALSAIDDA